MFFINAENLEMIAHQVCNIQLNIYDLWFMIYVVFMVLWIGAKIAYQIEEEKNKKNH